MYCNLLSIIIERHICHIFRQLIHFSLLCYISISYNIAMNRNFKVALLLDTSRNYGRELTQGIIRYSQLYGPWSFYSDDQFYLNRPSKSNLSYLKKWGVDGIVTRDFKEAGLLLELKVPIIIARNHGHLDTAVQIRTANLDIGKMAFDFFCSKGFKDLAFCGFSNMPWSDERQSGFTLSAAKTKLKPQIFNSPSSKRMLHRNKEYTRLADWLKKLPKPIGIFCCNDDRGYDVIECCRLANIKVPYDIAVLGVDNDNLACNLSNPKLSSIYIDVESAGFETAATLHKLMSGETVENRDIIGKPVNISERHSTDIMAIEDASVKAALQFIREQDRKLIQTEDVASAVSVSRRSLESRFQKVLGHSVFAEIRRNRIEKISKLLIETDFTISEIALMLGYNDSDHIARFFKAEKNLTPKQYRNAYSLKKSLR